MALSLEDARELADLFQDAATAIRDYLRDNFDTSDSPDYQTLNDFAKTLILKSSSMTTAAVGLAINDMANDAAELKQVTTKAKENLAHLQDIRTVITVATGLVDLATAIVSRNASDAFNAARDLWDTLQEDGD